MEEERESYVKERHELKKQLYQSRNEQGAREGNTGETKKCGLTTED